MGFRFRCVAVLVLVVVAAGLRAEEPVALWWSFQPIVRPQPPDVPQIRNTKYEIRNEIDRFILAKLKDKGLSLSPEADRRTLIRRVTFDLTGLPPTPEEVEAFVDGQVAATPTRSSSIGCSPRPPTASAWRGTGWTWSTSPRRTATTRTACGPNAWRYRDYLIHAFNADTPYARFVQEQVAADVLFPDEPKLIPALGFLAAGPWDESSLRDIREDTHRPRSRPLPRPRRHRRPPCQHVPGPDGPVCPLPRSQVRPDLAGGVLPAASRVRRRRPRRRAVRARPRDRAEAEGVAGDAGGDSTKTRRRAERRGSIRRSSRQGCRRVGGAAPGRPSRGTCSEFTQRRVGERGEARRSSPTARSAPRARGRRRTPTRSPLASSRRRSRRCGWNC